MKKLVKLNSDFTNAKVGDKVSMIGEGIGVIENIIPEDTFPIKCNIDDDKRSFTTKGYWREHDKQAKLFNGHHENLVVCTEVEEETAPLEQKELDLEILLKEYIKAKQTLETIKQQIKDIV